MTTQTETTNGKITKTTLGFEDHGVLTYYVEVVYGKITCSFGGFGPGDGKFFYESVRSLLRALGADSWESLAGKYVRVKHTPGGWGGRIHALGHIVEDRWFSLEELSEELQDA